MKKSDNFDLKWGDQISNKGWVAIPTSLFFNQKRLNINSLEMNVLTNLIMHWWDKEKPPYPSQAAIANRIGVSVRTIQRALDELAKKGIIEKQSSSVFNPVFKGRNVYNLEPLVLLLSDIEKNTGITE